MAKRKRKLKKSFIVIIAVIILMPVILVAYNLTMNKENDTTNKSTSTTLTEEDKYFINKNYSKKELSYINKLSDKNKEKLKNIDYIDISNYYNIKNFDVDKYSRYEAYHEKNKDYKYKDVVTYVNIGIDNEFYTNTSESPFQHTNLVLINKYYHVDNDYTPKDLVVLFDSNRGAKMTKEAAENYKLMVEAAKKDNITLESTTAYRGYNFQKALYDKYVSEDGKEKADTYSARPGYSDHQSGLTVDLNDPSVKGSRLDEKDYKWLLNNAHNYGFVVRYQESKVFLTGYMEENWHIRYVGKDVATIMHDEDLCLEEYLDLYKMEY